MRRLLLFLSGLWLLLGCTPAPQPPLRLLVNPWLGYDPFVLAQEAGFTDPARLRVVETPSNSESQRLLANGLAEAAALTLDEALRLADAGVPLRLVAVLDISHGADAVLTTPDIATPAQLKGRRIGVETGAVGALVLAQLLAAGGLRREDVEIVPIEASQQAGALINSRVDALITFEPMRTQLARRGFRILFDSRAMPEAIIDVLVVRAEVADVGPIIEAWRKGLAEMQSRPSESADKLARGGDLSVEEYQAALAGLRFIDAEESRRLLSGLDQAPIVAQAQPLVAELLALGLLQRPPDWARLLAPAQERR